MKENETQGRERLGLGLSLSTRMHLPEGEEGGRGEEGKEGKKASHQACQLSKT